MIDAIFCPGLAMKPLLRSVVRPYHLPSFTAEDVISLILKTHFIPLWVAHRYATFLCSLDSGDWLGRKNTNKNHKKLIIREGFNAYSQADRKMFVFLTPSLLTQNIWSEAKSQSVSVLQKTLDNQGSVWLRYPLLTPDIRHRDKR